MLRSDSLDGNARTFLRNHLPGVPCAAGAFAIHTNFWGVWRCCRRVRRFPSESANFSWLVLGDADGGGNSRVWFCLGVVCADRGRPGSAADARRREFSTPSEVTVHQYY